jgi:sensor histidine kinase YesM
MWLENFVFSNLTGVRVARHLLYWVGWWAILAFVYGTKWIWSDPVHWLGINRSYWVAAAEYLPSTVAMAGATYALLYWAIPTFYPRRAWSRLTFFTLLILMASAVFDSLGFLYISNPLRQSLGRETNTLDWIIFIAFTNVLKHAIGSIGLLGAIRLFKQWWHEREINQQLRQTQLESELQWLRLQLHPHFLFNTLNNLYGLIGDRDNKQALEVVERLSGLLRYMLYDTDTPAVPLDKELQHLRDYLLLEKIRCEDRLDIAVSIKGDPSGKNIAPLLLLPFLENSFKHGVAHQIDQAWINLQIRVDDESLSMHLSNGKSDQSPNDVACGIGLDNAKRRLALLYPERHRLYIAETEDTYTVKLYLLLRL